MDLVYSSSSSSSMDCSVFFSDECSLFRRSGVCVPHVSTSAPPSLNSPSMEAPSAVHHVVRMSRRRLPVIIFVSHIEFLIMFMLYVARSALSATHGCQISVI